MLLKLKLPKSLNCGPSKYLKIVKDKNKDNNKNYESNAFAAEQNLYKNTLQIT